MRRYPGPIGVFGQGDGKRGRIVAFGAGGLARLSKVHKRLLTAILAVAALGLGTATVASGLVPIYENHFSSSAKFRQVKKMSGGKDCSKVHKAKKRFLVTVDGGSTKCIYRTPVEGDGPGPDHQVSAQVKVEKTTSSKIRNKVYGAVGARAGKKTGYELRVFPKRGRWEVHRSPNATGFPVKGSLNKIKGVGKTNELQLKVFGNTVVAHVNGKKVMARTDGKAAQVSGRNTTIVAASEKKTNKAADVTFDAVRVKLPNP